MALPSSLKNTLHTSNWEGPQLGVVGSAPRFSALAWGVPGKSQLWPVTEETREWLSQPPGKREGARGSVDYGRNIPSLSQDKISVVTHTWAQSTSYGHVY